MPEDELLRKLAKPQRLRLPRRAASRPQKADQGREAQASRASSSSRATRATTRATGWPRSCSAASAPTARASAASSTSLDAALTRHRRRAADGQGRDGQADRDARHEAGRARRTTSRSRSTPTSRTRPRRCSTRSAETWQPKGATAIVMDPDSGAILALANWPRVNANALEESPDYARQNRAVAATYEPGSTFKAFTVAAALEDGKVDAGHEVQRPAGPRRRRPRAPRRRGPRLGDDDDQRDPQVLLEHRRGADRAHGSARSRSTPGSTGGASASRPASTCRARSRASCCRSSSTRARPWATCRSARASRSRRCRWPPPTRRSPTAASCARRTSSRPSAASRPRRPAGQRVISEATAASVRKMLEGVARPGRHRVRRRDPGLRPRGQDRHGREGDQRRVLQGQVRRVVRRLRARQAPEAARRR